MQPGPANIRFSVGRKRATSQAIAQMAANGPGKDCSRLRAVTQVRAAHALRPDEARRSTGTAHCTLGDLTRETTGIVRSARAEATGKAKGRDTWQGLIQLPRPISEIKDTQAGKTDSRKSVLVASNVSVEIVTVKSLPAEELFRNLLRGTG